MQFKNPEILFALFALLIPIIVHLFHLRKFQKENFTNVAFLKQVTLQTRKSSVIKKWLTLLARLLALAAIILAFAQPYTSVKNSLNSKTENVVYLDNSFSLQAKGNKGELLKRAVQDLISAVPENQNISILTNSQTFKNTSIKAIKNELLQLDYAANQLNYDAVILKGKTLFSKNKSSLKNLILISDFQQKENSFQPKKDSLIRVHTVALKPVNTNNTSLDSVYISKINANTIDLKVLLKNSGAAKENIPVSLYNNNKLIAKTAVSITDKEVANFTIPLHETVLGEITIDDNALQFDNSLYFNINKSNKIKVLEISNLESSNYLKRIFTDSEFTFTASKINALPYSIIDSQNLIILNELNEIPNALKTTLNAFTKAGGFVLIIPSSQANISDYNSYLTQNNLALSNKQTTEKKITSINYSHPLFENVFDKRVSNFQYPKVNNYYSFKTQNASNILQFEDGKPFLTNNKNTYIFAAALNHKNSNFTNSPLIVPTLYNIAKRSLQKPNLYYTIGKENQYDIAVTLQQDAILTIDKNEASIIPQQQSFNNKVSITTNELPNLAGVYTINKNTNLITNVSYNFERNESNLLYQNLTNIKNTTTNDSINLLFENLKKDSKINELWKWFVILTFVFLIIEMLLLKYLK